MIVKLGLRLENQVQFKCDLEQNTFCNITLATEAKPMVEMVQHSTGDQTTALSHYGQGREIEHSSNQATICSPITKFTIGFVQTRFN
jgi:hypothetical protein